MNREQPLVSVIIPVYNAEEYLKEAVESIINQTYQNLEINIINDGSTDASDKIIRDLQKIDKRIKYIKRENRGLPITLNELIDMSNGIYMARMDADDYSYPRRIEEQVKYMEKSPKTVVLGTSIAKTDDGRVLYKDRIKEQDTYKARMLFQNCGIAHPTVMMRRCFFEQHSLRYREDIVTSEDYFLWVDTIIAGGVIDVLPHVLLEYRITRNQMSSRNIYKVREQDRKIRCYLLEQYGEFSAKEKEILVEWIGDRYHDNIDEANLLFKKIIAENERKGFCNQNVLRRELVYQWCLKGLLAIKYNRDFRLINPRYIIGLSRGKGFFYAFKWIAKDRRREYCYDLKITNKKDKDMQ